MCWAGARRHAKPQKAHGHEKLKSTRPCDAPSERRLRRLQFLHLPVVSPFAQTDGAKNRKTPARSAAFASRRGKGSRAKHARRLHGSSQQKCRFPRNKSRGLMMRPLGQKPDQRPHTLFSGAVCQVDLGAWTSSKARLPHTHTKNPGVWPEGWALVKIFLTPTERVFSSAQLRWQEALFFPQPGRSLAGYLGRWAHQKTAEGFL